MNIEKVIDMRDANEACDLQNNCNECIISYGKMTPCNFIRNKYKDSIWNYKEESRQLEEYIKNNPNEKLMTGLTVLDKWYVRPMNWCGMWKKNKLLGGRCLAYFDTKEDLDNTLIRLGYEIDQFTILINYVVKYVMTVL